MKTRNCGSGEMLADYYKARNGCSDCINTESTITVWER